MKKFFTSILVALLSLSTIGTIVIGVSSNIFISQRPEISQEMSKGATPDEIARFCESLDIPAYVAWHGWFITATSVLVLLLSVLYAVALRKPILDRVFMRILPWVLVGSFLAVFTIILWDPDYQLDPCSWNLNM